VPVPVNLAQESYTVVDSGTVMEKVCISNDSSCGIHELEDDSAASMTSVAFNNESKNVYYGETLVNLSASNTEPVSESRISDICDSLICQANYGTDCNKPETDPTATEKCYRVQTVEDAIDCKDACFSLLQGQSPDTENDLVCRDSDNVDICRLGSLLWPKSIFVTDTATDYSFAALTADHENFCKENLEDVTSQKMVLSGSGETETSSVRDIHREEWLTVSRWLQESKQKFTEQFPQCSILMHGIPTSESNERLDIDSNTSSTSKNMTVCTDSMQTANSTPFSSEMNAESVPSSDSRISDVSSYVNDAGLGVVPDCRKQLPSAVLLSREKILSLQFSAVPLSPQVMSRIKELRLRRTGDVLRPGDWICKWSTKNRPLSRRLQPNLSGGTVLPSAPVSAEIIANSASMKDDGQSVNQSAVKNAAVSAVGTSSTARCHTLHDPRERSLDQAPANYESHISTSVPAQPTASGLTRAALNSHSMPQSTTAQSNIAPIVSYLSPLSNTRADSADANVTSYKGQPINKLSATTETTRGNPFKLPNTDVMPLSNSALVPTSSVSITTVNTTATALPESAQSITMSQLSPQAASLEAISERRPGKKRNTKMTEISKTLSDHNYHKDIQTLPDPRYNENFVSVSIQQHILQSEHNVAEKNPHRKTDRRFMEERYHRSRREGSRFAEVSASSPVLGVGDSQSRSKSRCAKCSRCRNVKSNAGPTSNNVHSKQSHASKHQTPYNTFDHYDAYRSCYMPNMTPSVLASVSYYSYYLGAYDAHVHSMRYYNMVSHQNAATMWQQQADYIRRLAKFYAHS